MSPTGALTITARDSDTHSQGSFSGLGSISPKPDSQLAAQIPHNC